MKIVLSILCAVFFIYDIYWFHELHRAKELIRIQRVIDAANIAAVKNPTLIRRIQALDQIDCSDCPKDFQEAWVAYVQEQTDLANQGKGTLILDVGAGVAAVSEKYKAAEEPDGKSESLPPQTAKEHLLRVMLEYKSVCPN